MYVFVPKTKLVVHNHRAQWRKLLIIIERALRAV